eukprot:PhF_6_TR6890/c0_g1_i2/m.9971
MAKKAEMYSLGVILYEMAMLQLPFRAPSVEGLLTLVSDGVYESLPLTYSEDFRQVVDGLLQKDSSKRPSLSSIFRVSKWQEGLRMFVKLFNAHDGVSETWRRQIATHALDLLSEVVSAIPQQVSSQAPNVILRKKRDWESLEDAWREEHVEVDDGSITFADARRKFAIADMTFMEQGEDQDAHVIILVYNVDGIGEVTFRIPKKDESAWISLGR